MRTSKLLLALFLLLIGTSAFAQVTDTYIIPVSANVQGGNNTRWLTQFSLMNPHLDYKLMVSVTFLPTGGAVGTEKLIELPANATFITDDVLTDVFHTGGSGALLVATFAEDNPNVDDNVLSRAFLVNSNTYNNASSGTYGQTIPGVWTGLLDVDTDGITAIAQGIDNSSRLKFRTNIGAANLGACSVTVLVSAYDPDGNRVLTRAPLYVPPYAHIQDRLPVSLEGGSVEFEVQDPCANDAENYAVVFPYVSTIDDLSGDPRYQTPVLLASPGTIFGKKAVITDSTKVGKKIDSTYARGVRAHANRAGSVTLVRSERGWQVAK